MSADCKPGTVRLMRVDRWSEAREWPEDTSQVLMRLDEDGCFWSAVEGDPAAPFCVHVSMTDYYRPLVVLDLSPHEVMRALEALRESRGMVALTVADKLEAATRPPKPPEPQGLGAVVEDASGERWMRIAGHEAGCNDWRLHRADDVVGSRTYYIDIDAVRVLSDGWEPKP